jgi:hypothetical protein
MKCICSAIVVQRTLDKLKASGADRKESVVFWVAPSSARDEYHVSDIFVPVHAAAADYFHIGRDAMRDMMRFLRKNRLALVAQVHSHPNLAFHSKADDEWAVVRREGALSIVVPFFGSRSTPANFTTEAAFFSLTHTDKWVLLDESAISARFEIVS